MKNGASRASAPEGKWALEAQSMSVAKGKNPDNEVFERDWVSSAAVHKSSKTLPGQGDHPGPSHTH
jgi:hypothetical protein